MLLVYRVICHILHKYGFCCLPLVGPHGIGADKDNVTERILRVPMTAAALYATCLQQACELVASQILCNTHNTIAQMPVQKSGSQHTLPVL